MSRSKNVATRAGYLLVKTASFTLNSPPLRPNVQQDPCGRAVEVNAMTAMRLRPVARGRVGCHVAGPLQLRGPPDTAPQRGRVGSWFRESFGASRNATAEHDARHGFGRARRPSLRLARCSEQSRRKAVTQSHGANAVSIRYARRAASDPEHGSTLAARSFFHQRGRAMTFMHKLASRLARLKPSPTWAAFLTVAFVFGCEKPIAVTGPGSTITQFVVSPQNVTLQPNQTQDFLAVGFTATGDSADVGVTWTATGGSVDPSSNGKRHYGNYHNANCGSFTVVATSNPGNMSASASVTVTGCTVPVASVSVTPASATVAAGQSAQLTATPQDANGNPLSGRTESGLPLASCGVAVSCADCPAATVADAGVKLTDATGTVHPVTVTLALADILPGLLVATTVNEPQLAL